MGQSQHQLLEVKSELYLVNGRCGDPAVYYSRQREGTAFLFDLGVIDNLSNRDILKVDSVFVSHAHIDHFIGFDRFLRVNVPHFRVRRIFGPTGMARNVASKLRGYIWNLLQPGQIVYEVVEVEASGATNSYRVSNDLSFEPILEKSTEPTANGLSPLFELETHLKVSAAALDHHIDSIAYRLDEPERWRVVIERVQADGLVPGPWLRQLQVAMLRGQVDALVDAGNGLVSAQNLAQSYLEQVPGRSLGYMTDAVFSVANLKRCQELFNGVNTLICETCFLGVDRERAAEKKHLTAEQAALIAACCGAKEVVNFHVSSIYGAASSAVEAETQERFAYYQGLSANELEALVEVECEQIVASLSAGD